MKEKIGLKHDVQNESWCKGTIMNHIGYVAEEDRIMINLMQISLLTLCSHVSGLAHSGK